MALKGRTSRTYLFATCFVLDLSLIAQLITFSPTTGIVGGGYAPARERPATIAKVIKSEPDIVQSVYVQDTLALQVVQQPEGHPNYVSPNEGQATQFSAVSQYGNIGLLAHNYLSGRDFSQLALGQQVDVYYKNGGMEHFVITKILHYQALEPKSPYSSFRNLDDEDEVLSATEMFERAYGGDHHITFQTCIAKYGNSSWGRLFVVATPEQPSMTTLSMQSQSHAIRLVR